MRPIKFRAFHLEEKRMFYPQQIVFMLDGRVMADEIIMDVQHHSYLTQNGKFGEKGPIILMQFTGLYDKNGKEIWEGDIVKLHEQNALAELTGEVKYGLGGNMAGQFVCYQFDGFRNLIEYEIIEVLGNIYEHRHFLDK